MKYFSLFAGVGGFEKGIENAYRSKNRGSEEDKETYDEERKGLVSKTGKTNGNAEGQFSQCSDDIGEGCEQTVDSGQTEVPKDCLQPRGDKPNSAGRARGCCSCVGFSEVDRYAVQVYKRHFPDHKNYGDAKEINPSDLPDFDMLCGGFPCFSFSIAGKRKGFDDPRGTLFFEICRIAKEKKPRYLLLENVKGLLSSDEGKTLEVICKSLNNLGYIVNYEIYNSKDFGVPQNRERVFFICERINAVAEDGLKGNWNTSKQIIESFLFQLLLNNLKEAKKVREENSKDLVLGLLILKEITNGLKKKFRFSKRTHNYLWKNYPDFCQIEDALQSTLNQEVSELKRKHKKDTILILMEEKSSTLDTGLVWQSIDILLKSIWEENYLEKKQYTISTVIKEIIDWKTFTYFQMLLGILTLIVQLRASSKNLWNVILSDLILIQEDMNYARISHRTKETIISESNCSYFPKIFNETETKKIIGHSRESGGQAVFPLKKINGTTDVEIKRIGHMNNFRRYNQTYDPSGIVEALDTASGGGHQPCVVNKDISYAIDANCWKGTSYEDFKEKHRRQLVGEENLVRRLTPFECERLQAFPDGWTEKGIDEKGKETIISDCQRYKMLGNAVTTTVVQAIMEKIIEVYE